MEHPHVFSRAISTTKRSVWCTIAPARGLGMDLHTGASFDYHPLLTNVTVVVEDANHPSTTSFAGQLAGAGRDV
jgi:hypothetical protein